MPKIYQIYKSLIHLGEFITFTSFGDFESKDKY